MSLDTHPNTGLFQTEANWATLFMAETKIKAIKQQMINTH